jgi:thiamine-monophosphate kinase
MPKLFDIGERNVVTDLIKKFDPDGAGKLGDDCGILDMGHEYLLVTTDMITRDTHLPPGSKPEDIGWYAAAINLSDIAAMGGEPMGMLFAMGLPRDMETEWLDSLAFGIHECCSSFDVPVLGGDTKENASLTISGTAIGRVPKDRILSKTGRYPRHDRQAGERRAVGTKHGRFHGASEDSSPVEGRADAGRIRCGDFVHRHV